MDFHKGVLGIIFSKAGHGQGWEREITLFGFSQKKNNFFAGKQME